MIRFFRALSETWAARIFFLVLVGAFALWGIGDVLRAPGGGAAVAKVGGQEIGATEFQEAFSRQMQQVTRMMGRNTPTPEIRRAVGGQTLDELIGRYAVDDTVRRLGLVVPDDVLRRIVTSIPQFRGPNNEFDRTTFNGFLRNNGLTETRFLDQTRSQLAQGELFGSIATGVVVPQVLVKQLYTFQNQTRAGEIVELPFASAAQPPAPTPDDLQRQYENDPARYSAPEFRRITLVVLSPEIVARGMEVSDDEARSYYESHQSTYNVPGKRAADVITVGDESKAAALAAEWRAGADWSAMQQKAAAAGASTVNVDLSSREQIPSPELADALFKADPNTVVGPIKSALAWQVFRVTKEEKPVSHSFDDVKAEVKAKLAQDRAADEVYARANKMDDALSAGTDLERLPGELGAAAVIGTTDAQGNTPEGEPAPIPGSPELRAAILKSAFATAKGDPPHMIEGPGQSFYALQVDDITPGQVKPFDAVKSQVAEDWQAAQRRQEQNRKAAQLMQEATAKGSLDDAATVAGLRLSKTPAATRSGTVEGLAPQVQQALFREKQGETTMVETSDGFVVVRLTDVVNPDPAQDPAKTDQLRATLQQDLQRDLILTYANALRDEARPQINPKLLNSLTQ